MKTKELTIPQYEHIEVRSFRGLDEEEEDTLLPPAVLPPPPVSSLLVAMIVVLLCSRHLERVYEEGKSEDPAALQRADLDSRSDWCGKSVAGVRIMEREGSL